jgi:hypothetical protein
MSEWLKWSQSRLLITLGFSYVVFAEIVSLLLSDGATCIVNPPEYGSYYSDSNECPALHIFLFKVAARVFKILGDPNNITAIATIAIAAFTGTLWWSTRSMQKATLTSIDLARAEFNSTHRPKIRLKHLWLTADIWEGQKINGRAVFVNVGTTDAFLREINYATLIIREGRQLPANVDFVKENTRTLGMQPIGAGISVIVEDLNDNRVFKDLENVAIREGKAFLYFFGAIEYQARTGGIRKTAFCRKLILAPIHVASDRGRFIKVEDPDYEYED